MLLQRGLQDLLHYLDGFLFVKPPVTTCKTLGDPVVPEKVEGRAITITSLGIELDSVHLLGHLPQDKLPLVDN